MEIDGNDVHVTLVGEIDAESSATLQQRLDQASELAAGALVLDMSGVSFIDSMGIRVVVATRRRLQEHGRSLVLRNVSAPARRVLDLTGLGPTFGFDGPT